MTFIISDEQKKGIPEPTQEDLDKITEIISSNPNVKVQKKRKGAGLGYENQTLIRKTKDIFEQVKKRKIDVQFRTHELQTPVLVGEGYNGEAVLTLGKTKDESTKTSLERGLAYVAFDTSKASFKKTVSDLSQFAKPEHQNQVGELIESAYAALEARRVHSCMGYIFKGFEERYKDGDRIRGTKLFLEQGQQIDDPITALQVAQLGLEEEVEKSQFPQANNFMKDVEKTVPEGSIILANDYVEEVIKPWYIANFMDNPEAPQGSGQGDKPDPSGQQSGEGGNSGEGQGEGEGEVSDEDIREMVNQKYDQKHKGKKNWEGKKPTEKQLEYLQKLLEEKGEALLDKETPQTRGGVSDKISELVDEEPITSEEDETPQSQDPLDKVTDKVRENREQTNCGEDQKGHEQQGSGASTLEEAQEKGEEMVEALEERLSEAGSGGDNTDDMNARIIKWKKTEVDGMFGKTRVHKHMPITAQPNVDEETVRKLKSVFKKLKSKPKTELSESGGEVDVEEFINDEIEGGHEFFVEDVEQQGFAVVIGIDESGSMGGTPIQIARNLCGTLYKAFENMPNVEIHVIGWQSNQSNCDVHIIKSFKEVGSLHTGGGTPFRQATIYLGEYVRKLPQKKKLLFQITDGGISYDDKTKHYLEEMRKDTGTIITGMHVSYYGGGDPAMVEMFGKDNFMKFTDMEDVKNLLVKDITKRFVRYMSC